MSYLFATSSKVKARLSSLVTRSFETQSQNGPLSSQYRNPVSNVFAFFNPTETSAKVDIRALMLSSRGYPTPASFLRNTALNDQFRQCTTSVIPLWTALLCSSRRWGGDSRDPSGKFKHFTELKSTGLLKSLSSGQTRVNPRQDLTFLVYSSGTTGLPKGVQLTHTNIIANIAQLEFADRFNAVYHSGGPDGKGDKQLAILPFFHVYGLTVIALAALRMGLMTIVLPKFDLERACQVIQEYGVTFASIPPPVVLALAKSPIVSKYDLSSVRFLNSGAAPLGRDLVEMVWDRLTIPIMQGYGLSETSPTLTKGLISDWKRYNGSVGKLLPNVEAKIVDPDGKESASGQEGEVLVKGPNVFPGYLNRPELHKDTFSEDGYFKTGDIGYFDPKGNLYITDRVKELIKYKGFQVAPAELEGLLLGHDEVADACVIPAHDKQRETEVPRAYIVMKPGLARDDAKAAEIVEWLDARVAQHKKLRGGVRFIDEIPKNASGKLLRRILKEQAKAEDRAAGAKL
ncbi:hypothetical protein F5Y18DRAFT_438496 [Xylariaceae sp. FL1019]|nr:hypothetical protein F5Y18DRAFT_438496 [Xylariaceae sp. FL1019]